MPVFFHWQLNSNRLCLRRSKILIRCGAPKKNTAGVGGAPEFLIGVAAARLVSGWRRRNSTGSALWRFSNFVGQICPTNIS